MIADQPIQPLPIVMTTDEVATLLRCSPDSVKRYVFSHQLAAIRIGRERRFRAEDVLEFVASRPLTARSRGRRPHSQRGGVDAVTARNKQ